MKEDPRDMNPFELHELVGKLEDEVDRIFEHQSSAVCIVVLVRLVSRAMLQMKPKNREKALRAFRQHVQQDMQLNALEDMDENEGSTLQ